MLILLALVLVVVLLIVLFVVLAVLSASALHAIGRGSFRDGFRLLFAQCMGLLGAPLGLGLAWLAHAYVLVPNGVQGHFALALVVGAILGVGAGVGAAVASMRVTAWLYRLLRRGADVPEPLAETVGAAPGAPFPRARV